MGKFIFSLQQRIFSPSYKLVFVNALFVGRTIISYNSTECRRVKLSPFLVEMREYGHTLDSLSAQLGYQIRVSC